VRRWVCFLLVVWTIALASGLVTALAFDGCVDGCPGEQGGGTCPPDCALCGCCLGARPILVVRTITVSAPVEIGIATVDPLPTLWVPEPREIAHVPRLLS